MAVGAAVLARIRRYKMIHFVGFAIFMVGRGLYTLLDEKTSVGEWVVYQLLAGIGAGLLLNTLLPAFQAPLQESDQAAATATWNFFRTMGSVWGIAIPAAIFANHVDTLVGDGAVSDSTAAQLMAGGGAYQFASAKFVQRFAPPVQQQIRAVYQLAIRRVWIISFAFMGMALLLVLLEKDIPLRKVLETEYGMKEKDSGGKVAKTLEEAGRHDDSGRG